MCEMSDNGRQLMHVTQFSYLKFVLNKPDTENRMLQKVESERKVVGAIKLFLKAKVLSHRVRVLPEVMLVTAIM